MGKIKILAENIANKIAAGEVVERPASVIKELVENSLDAGGTDITIEVKNGGKELIRVVDNGAGMPYDDALLSIARHATSKIQSVNDLESISTFGFRGEALPSIASVSHLDLITKQESDMEGTRVRVEGGVTKDVERVGCPTGTRITVSNLFYNVPARRKFLKSNITELDHIVKYVTWAGLAHPGVSFKLISNDKPVIEARRCNSVMERIYTLFGREFADNIASLDAQFETIKVSAYIGKPGFTRTNRDYQLFFLNLRPIRSNLLSAAVSTAFKSILPKGRYPIAILLIEMDTKLVDVNVHPAKMEVRFQDERAVYSEIMRSLLMVMQDQRYMPEISSEDRTDVSPETESPRKAEVESSISKFLKREEQKYNFVSQVSAWAPRGKDEVKPASLPAVIDLLAPDSRQDAGSTSLVPHPSSFPSNIQIKSRLFNTYIVAETDDSVLFIDQHIAEERVIYEKLKSQMSQTVPSQGLLLPVTIELSPSQSAGVDVALEMLKNMGFDLEPFGGRTIIIRAIPSLMQRGDVKRAVVDMLDQCISDSAELKALTSHSSLSFSQGFALPEQKVDGLSEKPEVINNEQDRLRLQDELLITAACHSSVQAGEYLTDAEIANLVKELFSTTQPFMCPHGRPIIVKMKKSELDEKFQRKT